MEAIKSRNIGIIAHIDAGKTTTTERILFYTGKNYKIGEVDDGAATMDWMAQEQERGITITAAATTCFWNRKSKDYQINIIDTPGHVDFTIEVERSLRVIDGAVLIICGASGVQPQTETVWRQAKKFSMPAVAFINKMDRKGADYDKILTNLAEKLNIKPIAISIPYFKDEVLTGVIDLIEQKLIVSGEDNFGKILTYEKIPARLQKYCSEKRQALLDIATEYNDTLLEQVLNEQELDKELIYQALRQACISRKILPTYSGSSFKNRGVQNLLNGVIDFLPSPSEIPPIIAHDQKGAEIKIMPAKRKDPLALLFKVQIDPYVGTLCYLRIYSGEFISGKAYWNENLKKRERILKLFKIHSSKKELIDHAKAGDIVAAAGLNESLTGNTFCTKEEPLLLETINAPEPVISVAIELKSSRNQSALEEFLKKLEREDPTFRANKDKETGQNVLYGMGELHLEILIDRIRREAGIILNIGRQQVAHREMPSVKNQAEEIFNKPLLGKNCYAKVKVEIIPQTNLASKVSSQNTIVEILPDVSTYTDLAEMLIQGCNEALTAGILAGNQVINSKVIILEVEATSNLYLAEAFKIASSLAVRKALLGANCKILTPQMLITIIVPTDCLGPVVSDLNQRKAKILSIKNQIETQEISGKVALDKILGYTTQLRSLTKGRGSFSMEFDGFYNLQ